MGARRLELVAGSLQRHARRTNETYYYLVHDEFNQVRVLRRPGRKIHFIFDEDVLGRDITVSNRSGRFEHYKIVDRRPPAIQTAADQLQRVRESSKARLPFVLEASTMCGLVSQRCTVYVCLECPYPPAQRNSIFHARYTKECFSDEDQKRLAKLFEKHCRKWTARL